ncbi:MAG TPA: NADH-quinone oxidoreductase subunit F, partial [Lachnospiraceae bacterium]|nr:NADH-quinone oxidoreductase subunit F [Lachnospiraceae bacterium]
MRNKITNLEQLNDIKEAEQKYMHLRLQGNIELTDDDQYMNILCCAGTGCTAGESAKLIERLNKLLEEHELEDKVRVIKTGCFGFCQKGPIVAIFPDRVFYTHVKPEDADRIINEHVIGGNVIRDMQMYDIDKNTGAKVYDIEKIGFYEKQQRIALRNCGKINP